MTDPSNDPAEPHLEADEQAEALPAIAIVGLAGRFPGARNVDELWRNLRAGVESIFPVSEAELEDSGLPPETWRDPRYVRASPSLAGIDLFDARFFGFSPREAALLDPQHRLFLETAWEALGNAGYDSHGYDGSIGVFAGCQFNQYLLWNVLPVSGSLHPAEIAGLRQLADKDYLATRTSYLLNLRGPSISVQTACSTSLVAAHLASRSLLGHECDMALVGGVCLTVPHRAGYLYQKGGILSPDGHCRPFAAAAQGTVMGSGAGVLVLKRLEDAVEDGDTIRAVLLGSSLNNDGAAKVGYTAPSVDAQAEAIAGAQSFAGISPDSISYVEAHGTGTPMGDPIEIAALTLAFRRGSERRRFCAVGSLKGNLGHLEAAAGVAGVIKTVLALEHGEIPPSLHCETPNPEIDWEGSPFFVNTELRPWKRAEPGENGKIGAPRRAGVSSFGVGGTNAHAVLEEAPRFVPGSVSRRWQLLPLSAKTATALETATSDLASHLGQPLGPSGDPDPARAFADAAYTLKVGRRAFAHRRIVVARDAADASSALENREPRRIFSRREERADRPVAFLFPGQGAQYPGMARGLYESEPVFREEIDRCRALLAPRLSLDLGTLLFPPQGTEPEVAAARLTETAHAQPALFAVEYALARLWMSWGVEPAALLGHSIGEYVAACLAGVFSLPDALALVEARGRLMQGTAPGAMLSLPLAEAEVLPLLGEELALAALNAPGLSVVSGPVEAIEALAARLAFEGTDARRLHASHAFHSPLMEPVLAAFAAEVAMVELSEPKIPFVSNLTGTWIRTEEATDPGYWARHLRGTVRFADGLAALRERAGLVLLEVGPGRTLATLVARGEPGGGSPVIPSLPSAPRARPEGQAGEEPNTRDDQEQVLTALGRLWLSGARIDWRGFYAGERRLRVPLPTHPFERQRYWIDPPRRSERRAEAETLAGLGLEHLGESPVPDGPGGAAGGASQSRPAGALGALHPRPDLETAYVAPRDETERLLAAIWEEMLGLAPVGVYDSFFELGGHSLMATQLVSRVRDRFAVELPLADFFDAPTIAALAPLVARRAESAEAGASGAPIPRAPRERPIPLTFAQQRLWFLDRLSPGAGYNMPLALRAEGALEPEALERALAEIVRRHESLRTTFALSGAGSAQEPVQVIAPAEEAATHLARVDLSTLADPLAAALQLAREEARASFDLERGPLFRARLLRLGEGDHVLLLTLHHIVSDGWSTGLLVRELAALNAAFSRGEESPLPPLPVQYADFAVWQQEAMGGERLAGQVAWWRERLGGALPALELPLDRPRPPLQTARGAKLPLALPPALADGLRLLARERGATLFMVLLAGFQTLLRRYTGQTDLLVGTPIAGRNRSELEGLIGLFANTLVLRCDLADNPSFGGLVDRLRGVTAGAYAHQEVPFERLVEELNPPRDLARSPLFQVMLSLDNNLAARAVPGTEAGGLAISPLAADSGAARYEQTWFLHEEDGGRIAGVVEYNTDLFDEATALRMAGCFRQLLAAAVADPAERITRLPLLSGDEERQLLVAWNETARPFRLDRPLHELIARQAARYPEAWAVTCEGKRLTYAGLEAQATALAHRLRALGVGPEVPVGLYLDRSITLPVALLAVWKAGGAYLPLDPAYPKDRLAYMLEDSKAPLVLTESSLLASLPATSARAVCVDQVERIDRVEDFETGAGESPPLPETGADSLAYVLYTSGSTGKPKGVQIPHGALVNFLESMRERPGLGPGDRLLAVTSLSFDIAGLELYLPLLAGAEVEIASRALTADGVRLLGRLAEATVFQATPSTWRLLLDAGWSGDRRLKALCGGEALPPKLAREIAARAGSLWNLYGPTETTIWSATRLVPADEREGTQPVSIGRPIGNTSIYIVDGELRPAPIGVPGELLIGGAGLARGYLGRPDLTAERFLPDPFARPESGGARLYRTGDLARYRPDGEIEFLGRIDHQVKVRGYRIELGEIEAALELHPGVGAAVVLVREDVPGDLRITAYLSAIPEKGGEVASGDLRRLLRSRLPEYMVPSAFVVLPELPLLPNGKVDRKSLPAPSAPSPAAPGAGAAGIPSQARGGIEETIAGAWRSALRLDRVGRDDNFFDLGGHSLLLAQVHQRLRATLPSELGDDLKMMELFQFPTIASLARHLAPGGAAPGASGETGRSRAELRRDASGRLGTEIAIVGMSGRFPGAPGVEAYWRNLCDGVESISRFSEEELLASGVPPETFRAANYINAKAIPDGIGWFDAGFFGYTPREAEIIDPQQRMFLEVAWEALEDAGCDPARHPGLIGVFAGSGFNTYLVNLYSNPDLMAAIGGFQATINNDKDFLPTRVSYKLDLKGPSLNVQTACSTSLVAVHVACQHLLHGECDLALAGGVTLYFPVKSGTIYHEGGVLAPDGRCHAFDDRAKGTVVGNGSGAVVLKRLDDALADGDSIYAVIKGSAINNDGSVKVGYTAPSVDGQVAVIAQALGAAGVNPGTIGYVEAHGTGTILGDPIEVRALTRAYRAAGVEPDRTGFCGLGSAKTAIGHLDTAAGVAGLIKATLAVERGTIPPSLNYEHPNPALEIETTPFYVVDKLRPWPSQPSDSAPRRAGVSAFGIGGTNAHVILEQAPTPPASKPARETQILLLSARTETALEAATDRLARWLREHEGEGGAPLADVAFTLQTGRKLFAQRRAVVAGSHAEAATALESRDPKRVLTSQGEGSGRPVVFLFAGGGTQYADMGLDLYRSEPLFRAELDRALDLFAPHVEADLRRHLFPSLHRDDPAPPAELERTSIALPVLFSVEMALARLWMSWGIQPQAMLGHSLGEYAAACLAGVMSLEDAVAMVALRGRLIETLPAGGMITVPLPEARVLALLGELLPGQDLSIAAVNGPAFCVVSGPAETIGEARDALAARGIDARRLHIAAAGHSALIEPILEEFGRFVATLALAPPAIPYLSNVTGTWITASDATDPNYWCRHLRQTVRFAEGAALLLEDPDRIFLEVGAGQTLSTLVRQHPARKPSQAVLPSLRHPQDPQPDGVFLLAALGKLWQAGADVDWKAFQGGARRRVRLPTYPFDRQYYWVETRRDGFLERQRKSALRRRPDPAGWLYAPAWRQARLPAGGAEVGAEAGAAPLLVFLDRGGVGEQLAARLRGLGHRVVSVVVGAAYGRVEEGEGSAWTVRPRERSDYEALLRALDENGQSPAGAVHLWCVGQGPEGVPVEDLGFYSLLALTQALAGRTVSTGGEPSPPFRLDVVTSGLHTVVGGEEIEPEKALILGIVKVAPQEIPNLRCRALDVVLPKPGSRKERNWVEQLVAEVTSGESETSGATMPDIAYRNGQRWVLGYESVGSTYDEPNHESAESTGDQENLRRGDRQVARQRPEGFYLITGGLGGVGSALAAHLARRSPGVRLVLLGRTPLPERSSWDAYLDQHPATDRTARRLRRLLDLETLGANVLPASADVCDLTALRAALASARDHFGVPLRGVIHAAGVAPGGMIQTKTPEMADEILAAKTLGTRALAEAVAAEPLDFFLLCSAASSALGGFGRVDHCAASAYLDAFALRLAAETDLPVLSLDWDTWSETGVAAEAEVPPDLEEARRLSLQNGMATREALEVFDRALSLRALGLPRVVVSTRDLEGLLQRKSAAKAEGETEKPRLAASHGRPSLSTSFVAPSTPAEKTVAGVWEDFLGIQGIGAHDNFFELGGHSLMATQITSRLRDTFRAELSIATFFTEPTVAGLAAALSAPAPAKPSEAPMAAPAAPKIDDLLDDIEGLSEEELDALLAAEESRAAGEGSHV